MRWPPGALSLDVLLKGLAKPQVLKIDVEGAERLVLQGAVKLLSSVRPRLYIEVAAEHSASIGELLRSNGYCLFDGATLDEVRTASGAPWDTVAIPLEQPIPEPLRGKR